MYLFGGGLGLTGQSLHTKATLSIAYFLPQTSQSRTSKPNAASAMIVASLVLDGCWFWTNSSRGGAGAGAGTGALGMRIVCSSGAGDASGSSCIEAVAGLGCFSARL